MNNDNLINKKISDVFCFSINYINDKTNNFNINQKIFDLSLSPYLQGFNDFVDNLKAKQIELGFKDLITKENKNIIELISNSDLFSNKISQILKDNINKFDLNLDIPKKLKKDVDLSKITLTAYRYDKDNYFNILENNKLEMKLNVLILNTGLSIEHTEGFWYENGDNSIEPGFTISGSKNQIEQFLPNVLELIENLENNGLSKEHQQSAIFVKLNQEAVLYELDDKCKYNKGFELPKCISFEYDENILKKIREDSTGVLNYTGGTVNENVVSMSFTGDSENQLNEIKKIVQSEGKKISLSDNIQMKQPQQKINNKKQILIGE